MPRTTSREQAEAHEALFVRLCALLEQVAAIAVRHPRAAVPAETRAIAAALLHDSRAFTSGDRAIPAAAGNAAALVASQLGQARAALEVWEVQHSHWNGECFVWRLTRGQAWPIQRLRAKTKAPDPAQRRHADHLRDLLVRRIDARFDEGYDRGYADARAGLPRRGDEADPGA